MRKDKDIRNLLNNIREATEEGGVSKIMDEDNPKNITINNKSLPGVVKDEEAKISQKIPSVVFDDNAFVLNTENYTVELSGSIQSLGNMKFKFTTDVSTPDGGLYIFANGLTINESTLQILSILRGHYEVWSSDWSVYQVKDKLKLNNGTLQSARKNLSEED